jgi:ribose transport system ATP-binding protein
MAEPVATPPRLLMRGVRKSFGATQALDGVELTVAPGEVHALIGENGAGKSTLMKILSGAIRPDAGSMQIDGVPYQPRHPLEARHAGVAMIYQELSLAPHMSVEDNVMLGMEPTRLGLLRRGETRAKTIDALARLGHPEISPRALVAALPVAARQIVEVARALAIGCRVLVLDEPTSALARADVAKLFLLVARLKEQGHAIVYISHFLEEVREVADNFTVLRDGRLAGGGSISGSSINDMVGMMVGRQVDELYPRSARTPGEIVLDVTGLAGLAKPEDASLTVRRGEVMGVAGLVGAGRTEFLRVIFGLAPIRAGEVKLGIYSGPAAPPLRWRQGAGLLSEDRKEEGLALTMSIADNLTLSKLSGLGPMNLIIPRRQDQAAARWVRELDIRCRTPRQPVNDLSGGNQQKVALARLLHHDVDVLLLDEPTRGIDVASKAQIYRLIDQLAVGDPARGIAPKAILMVSSYLPELLGVCDQIAVMHRGRLTRPQPASELDEHKLMLAATGQQ